MYILIASNGIGMVFFRQFSLGKGLAIRQFWFRIVYNLSGKWPVYK